MTYTARSPIPFSSRLLKIARFGMYAGPNFAGGQVLGDSVPPPPAAWNVAPGRAMGDTSRRFLPGDRE